MVSFDVSVKQLNKQSNHKLNRFALNCQLHGESHYLAKNRQLIEEIHQNILSGTK
jgi:hypothetical protein